MRILHLSDGDPRQPEIGGSAVRTREVVARLSERHEVTVLTAGYPGARERVEDGVRWVPVGPRVGTKPARLAFLALVGHQIRKRPHDLLVEDFGPPFSVGVAPAFTRKPVIGMVHWLFARELRGRYHLPFDWVERGGLRFYRHLIVGSEWLASGLRARSGADIEMIPYGVDDAAFTIDRAPPEHLLFVGRLDVRHKGLDLLIESFSRVREALGADTPPLLIAGVGADQEQVRRHVEELGLLNLVDFRGHVSGAAKYQLMARAFAVLMPSRYESFGIVALEAQASATPLVAFDVGPLSEVTGGVGVKLVAPFAADAFAEAILGLLRRPDSVDELGTEGREWARRRTSWAEIARRQEDFYVRVVDRT